MAAPANETPSGAMSTVRRTLLTLLVLHFLPFPFGWLPGTAWLDELFYAGRFALLQAVSLRLLGHGIEPVLNGSGDTSHEWLALAFYAVVALIVGAAWPYATTRRPWLAKVARVVRPYLRCALAAEMLGYGLAKVLPIQFGTPSWAILSQTYGDSSPMRLLWTFMGASRPYTIAAGLAEMLAGVLLLFDWTAGLGALVAAGVMSNVVLLNYCYDVPVKIGSTADLLLALFLLQPDAARVGRALWAARPRLAWDDRRARRAALLRACLVVAVSYAGVGAHLTESLRSDDAGLFAGFYEVTCDSGASHVPGWRNVEVTSRLVQARTAEGRGERFKRGVADATGAMPATRLQNDGSTAPVRLAFTRETDESVILSVHGGEGARRVCLRAATPPTFLLTRRGFHWINEFPFNF